MCRRKVHILAFSKVQIVHCFCLFVKFIKLNFGWSYMTLLEYETCLTVLGCRHS